MPQVPEEQCHSWQRHRHSFQGLESPHSGSPETPGIHSSHSLVSAYKSGIIFTVSNAPSNTAETPCWSGCQGSRIRKLTKGQRLIQRGKGFINPLLIGSNLVLPLTSYRLCATTFWVSSPSSIKRRHFAKHPFFYHQSYIAWHSESSPMLEVENLGSNPFNQLSYLWVIWPETILPANPHSVKTSRKDSNSYGSALETK